MESRAAAMPQKHHGHSVGFNLSVIALVVAAGALGLAYVIDAAGRSARHPGEAGSELVARTLGATPLTIPAAWLSGDDGQQGGFSKQVDLKLALPLGPDGASREIDVTLTQRSRVRPSASLLDGVYLHQFQQAQLSGPAGLIGKPLQATDGYEGETVWYDPLTSSPFVAKCQAPVNEGVAGKCLRTVYLGSGLAAVYAFDDDVLSNWRKFDAELHPILDKIGAL
jgi:hypothetical protein